MIESLITELGQISALKVISRTFSMHYKNTNKRLAEELNPFYIDLSSLKKACEAHNPFLPDAMTKPLLDELPDHPGFQDIIGRFYFTIVKLI